MQKHENHWGLCQLSWGPEVQLAVVCSVCLFLSGLLTWPLQTELGRPVLQLAGELGELFPHARPLFWRGFRENHDWTGNPQWELLK